MSAAPSDVAPPPETPRMAYFNAHTNPKKPPLLPPTVTEQLIAPVVTFFASIFVLLAIKPPFVQQRTPKGKPTGSIQITKVFSISLFLAILVVAIPFAVRWFKAEQAK